MDGRPPSYREDSNGQEVARGRGCWGACAGACGGSRPGGRGWGRPGRVDSECPGREGRDCERLEGDGRRRLEFDLLLRHGAERQPWPEQQLESAVAYGGDERLRAGDRLHQADLSRNLGDLRRAGHGRSGHARAGNTTDPAAHYPRDDGVGATVGDLGNAVGFPEGSGREQRHRESAVRWWKAVPGCDLELAGEVTGWSAVSSRWLHQQSEPGR